MNDYEILTAPSALCRTTKLNHPHHHGYTN